MILGDFVAFLSSQFADFSDFIVVLLVQFSMLNLCGRGGVRSWNALGFSTEDAEPLILHGCADFAFLFANASLRFSTYEARHMVVVNLMETTHSCFKIDIIFTCSLSCITSLLSLFIRAAPSSTVETLCANFRVLIVSPNESLSGFT